MEHDMTRATTQAVAAPATHQTRPQTGVVIYGPQGCGKTTHALALAAYFGKTRIVDDWEPGYRVQDDTLALTSIPHRGAIQFVDAISCAGIRLTYARSPA